MTPEELLRQQLMLQFETAAVLQGYTCIAGVDEAGRGPLAGPVVAAACILPRPCFIPGINDSKALTPVRRQKIYRELIEHPAVIFSIGAACHEEIDLHNIYRATQIAMLRAIEGLSVVPDYILLDAMLLKELQQPQEKIIRGDARSLSIAAASIIAKEHRDALMGKFHTQWPEYGFAQHKGYGTPGHLAALKAYGPCHIHRRSFSPVSMLIQR